MIRLPGVYMPQHLPTTTHIDGGQVIGFIMIIPFILWIGYLIYKSATEHDDDRKPKPPFDPNDDDRKPWSPPSSGGKPIDIHRWFEPDNPYVQGRIVRTVDVEQVLEKERERVTV
jgi:hypothetical protein